MSFNWLVHRITWWWKVVMNLNAYNGNAVGLLVVDLSQNAVEAMAGEKAKIEWAQKYITSGFEGRYIVLLLILTPCGLTLLLSTFLSLFGVAVTIWSIYQHVLLARVCWACALNILLYDSQVIRVNSIVLLQRWRPLLRKQLGNFPLETSLRWSVNIRRFKGTACLCATVNHFVSGILLIPPANRPNKFTGVYLCTQMVYF